MRSDFEQWLPGYCFPIGADGLRHAVIVIDGGILMDAEDSIACTGARGLSSDLMRPGIPNCIRCWAYVLT